MATASRRRVTAPSATDAATLDRGGYQIGFVDREGNLDCRSAQMTLRSAVDASRGWEHLDEAIVVIIPPTEEGGDE